MDSNPRPMFNLEQPHAMRIFLIIITKTINNINNSTLFMTWFNHINEKFNVVPFAASTAIFSLRTQLKEVFLLFVPNGKRKEQCRIMKRTLIQISLLEGMIQDRNFYSSISTIEVITQRSTRQVLIN